VAIAVTSDAAWQRLCAEAGWSSESTWTTLSGRLAACDAIERQLAAWTQRQSMDEVATRLQAIGVSAMPVLDGDDLRADAHLAARHALVTVQHPEVGAERHIANPVRFSRTPLEHAGPSPLLGADTEYVLREWLALAPSRITELIESGVCR
jgi:crotonobetainyl-CoA:carnitine CoA-transferase CaiB-like acyl-CoA transferase